MSNIFIDKKEELGISYLELGNRMIPKTNRGTVHKYLSTPGYWTRSTIIRLCNALDIDHAEGIAGWVPYRKQYLDELVKKKMDL